MRAVLAPHARVPAVVSPVQASPPVEVDESGATKVFRLVEALEDLEKRTRGIPVVIPGLAATARTIAPSPSEVVAGA